MAQKKVNGHTVFGILVSKTLKLIFGSEKNLPGHLVFQVNSS